MDENWGYPYFRKPPYRGRCDVLTHVSSTLTELRDGARRYSVFSRFYRTEYEEHWFQAFPSIPYQSFLNHASEKQLSNRHEQTLTYRHPHPHTHTHTDTNKVLNTNITRLVIEVSFLLLYMIHAWSIMYQYLSVEKNMKFGTQAQSEGVSKAPTQYMMFNTSPARIGCPAAKACKYQTPRVVRYDPMEKVDGKKKTRRTDAHSISWRCLCAVRAARRIPSTTTLMQSLRR